MWYHITCSHNFHEWSLKSKMTRSVGPFYVRDGCLLKRDYNYSYLTEKSALTTFREVAVSERWSLSRGAYTKVWFDFSETHSQDFIFNPFTPLTPVTAHINPCPLCHLWHHQFQTSWKRKRRGWAKERMRTVKGEVKPKNCFDIRLFTHA